MLTLLGSPRRSCDGVTRRETLQAGALSLLGGMFGLPSLGMAADYPPPRRQRRGKAKSVILLYLLGGAPTQDMFDLKPAAPDKIRTQFKPIATSAPGIEVCEHLPGLARWMHKAAVVRSVNHKAGCHNTVPSYTGYGEPLPGGDGDATSAQDGFHPSMGSVCEFLKQSGGQPVGKDDFPAYVYMPAYLGWGQAFRRLGPYGGFLGRRFDPLFTKCNPTADKPSPTLYDPQIVRGVPELPTNELPEGISVDLLKDRERLIEKFDDQLRVAEARDGFDRAQQQAFTLLTSQKVKSAFRLDHAPEKLRERYGRTLFGQSALIGRQLVEAGVRFVNVSWDIFWERPAKLDGAGWDTHEKNFDILKKGLLPYFDLAYSALMEDLDARGLLDETLVVVMSEMGRTPKINDKAGRDHWTFCYSVLFAGAGIKGGTAHGASDSQAAYVKENPVSPADICATIYDRLGIDPDMEIHDNAGQPVRIALGGRPIQEILA